MKDAIFINIQYTIYNTICLPNILQVIFSEQRLGIAGVKCMYYAYPTLVQLITKWFGSTPGTLPASYQ